MFFSILTPVSHPGRILKKYIVLHAIWVETAESQCYSKYYNNPVYCLKTDYKRTVEIYCLHESV